MRTRIVLQLASVMLLAPWSEGLFFEYPKKALMEFFQSLKEKKEAKKSQGGVVHHYHMHYYPSPVIIPTEHLAKAPGKRDLESLHGEQLRSLGWSDQEYKSVPEPEVLLPDSWSDQHEYHEQPWTWEDKVIGDHQGYHQPEVVVQVPLHQQIILQQPPKEEKLNPLSSFFQKIQRIKNTLFSSQGKNEDKCKDNTEVYANDLNTYVVYFRPKMARKM